MKNFWNFGICLGILTFMKTEAMLPNSLYEKQYDPVFLQAFEMRLLQLFQMSSTPKPISPHERVPTVLKHIYNYQMGIDSEVEVDDHLSEKTNSILHHPEIDNYELNENTHRLKFDFSLGENEKHQKTELLVHTELLANNSIIHIYKMNSPVDREKILSRRVVRGGSIERFDLSSVVADWSQSNHGIEIEIENGQTDHFRMRRSTDSEHDDSPVLISYVDDGSPSPNLLRSRRKTKSSRRKPNRRKKQEKPLCAKNPLYVDFRELEWQEWIVAPAGYDAWKCQGECKYPMDRSLNSTNHASFHAFARMYFPTEYDGPCCIPTKLSSLHLLYVDHQGRAVLKAYEDMVVEECGCR